MDRELAEQVDTAGVNLVVLKIDDPMKERPRRSRSSPTAVWTHRALLPSRGCRCECGINERCSFEEIKKILRHHFGRGRA